MSDVERVSVDGPSDESRRKFNKSGLAGAAVMLTLASKPVLGNPIYNCTVSGNTSGNVSSHGQDLACNTCGLSPGYYAHGGVGNTPGTWYGCSKSDAFSKYFEDYTDGKQVKYNSTSKQTCLWVMDTNAYENYIFPPDTGYSGKKTGEIDGFACGTKNKSCSGATYNTASAYTSGKDKGYTDGKVKGYSDGQKEGCLTGYLDQYTGYPNGYKSKYKSGCGSSTLSQYQQGYQYGYLKGYSEKYVDGCKEYFKAYSQCNGDLWALAQACVASLNNFHKCKPDYGVTDVEIKDMWRQCKNGSGYEVKPGVYWSTSKCKAYLESLYS